MSARTDRKRFLVYCGLTCMGGSEKRECGCSHPHDCEMRAHPEFEAYHQEAGRRLFRVAAAQVRETGSSSPLIDRILGR